MNINGMRGSMRNNGRRNGLQLVKNINRSSASLVLGLFLMAGAIAIQASHADTAVINSEAELGTVGGKAQKISSGVAGASGGGIVTFSSTGSGGGGGGGGGGGTGANGCTPTLCDPMQPEPGELFTATDGTPNYFRSLIPANPKLDPNSAAMVSQVGGNTPKLNGSEDANEMWQITVYKTKNSDPTYNPSFSQSGWGCSVGGSMHIPDYGTRETPGSGEEWDGWIVTYNTDDKTVKSIWQASKGSGGWSGGCGGSWPVNSNGAREAQTGVGTGADVQAGAGLILNSELMTNNIDHALYFTTTNGCSAYRPPAFKSDQKGSGGSCLPMGARVQLDPSVDCSSIGGAHGVKALCVAMQKYGGYILDGGGPGPISGIGVSGDDWTDPNRSPWQRPGNGFRGSTGCAPVSASCGIIANAGLDGSLSAIPWDKLRILASWNGQ